MRSLKSAFRNLRFLGKSYRVAGAGFLIVSWFLLAWMGARFLIVSAPLEHADAIVLLSGSSAYVERAELAAQLYKEGRAPQIILTNDNRQGGWSNTEQRNPFFYERARWELENLGVPRSNIAVILEPVNSTYDEAELLRRYSESYRLHSVVLVTSAYHSRRALWTFRRVFANSGKEIGIQSAAPGFQTPIPTVWWLYPKGWQVVAAEYVKIAYYWLR